MNDPLSTHRKRMLRRLGTALLIMIAASVTGGAARARAVSGSCAPKDARSDRLIAHFKAFVGKTDMGGTIEKKTMGVETVTPSQVALVTDNAVCTKAAVAFDKTQLQKRSSYTLYVVTLGSSYGVEETKMLQAGFETADVFDSNWKYIGVRQIHS
jgi:hypothetical protein